MVTGAAAGAAAAVSGFAVSGLKSLAVGGGTLAGSGSGTAASMARSAGLFEGPDCALAVVAATVRKVAVTAISTRSKP